VSLPRLERLVDVVDRHARPWAVALDSNLRARRPAEADT
jgi:hypothetical protein